MTGEDSSISCDGLEEKRRASGFKAPKAEGLFWFPQSEDKVTGKQVKPPARHWRLSSQNIGNESYRKGDETHTSAEKKKRKIKLWYTVYRQPRGHRTEQKQISVQSLNPLESRIQGPYKRIIILMPSGCSPDVWLKKTSGLRRPYECAGFQTGDFLTWIESKMRMPDLKASRLTHEKHILNIPRLAEWRAIHGKNVNKWIVCALRDFLKKFLIGKEKVKSYLKIILSSNIKISSDPKYQPF